MSSVLWAPPLPFTTRPFSPSLFRLALPLRSLETRRRIPQTTGQLGRSSPLMAPVTVAERGKKGLIRLSRRITL